MRKYLIGFQLALSNELIYRVNFLFGRVRESVVQIALVFLYLAIPSGVNGYNQDNLLTYLVIGALISSMIFCYGMNTIANQIAEGDLANFLLRPISFLGFWSACMAATRSLLILSGFIQVGLLLILFPQISLPSPSVHTLPYFIVSMVSAVILVQIIDFIGGISSFWTGRTYGPRWLITVLVQFMSGALLPIDAMPKVVQKILNITPFPSLIATPIKIYLGATDFAQAILVQWIWIVVLGIVLAILWRRGVKTYQAYGR